MERGPPRSEDSGCRGRRMGRRGSWRWGGRGGGWVWKERGKAGGGSNGCTDVHFYFAVMHDIFINKGV